MRYELDFVADGRHKTWPAVLDKYELLSFHIQPSFTY